MRALSHVAVGCSLVLLWACSGAPDQDGAEAALPAPAAQPGDAPPGMVWVPGGVFMMGSDGRHANESERPVHPVFVDGFFMDVHTVTNVRFREFVAATGYVTVAERAPDLPSLMRQLPPGTPPPDPALLVAASLVFTPTTRAADLRDESQWWSWVPGASWRHPNGAGELTPNGEPTWHSWGAG